MNSKAWNWKDCSNPYWKEPAPEVYYLANRWNDNGLKRLLDLGCGIGRHSIFFSIIGFDVYSYDLSEDGVMKLKETAKEIKLKVNTRTVDMAHLPYDKDFFNFVLAYHVIYHSDRAGTEKVISEIQRVLTVGGEAYITFNSKNNPSFKNHKNTVIDENTIIKTEGVEAGIPHYYVDEQEIRRLLSDFEIVKFNHVEEIGKDWRSWHYFVLVRKR